MLWRAVAGSTRAGELSNSHITKGASHEIAEDQGSARRSGNNSSVTRCLCSCLGRAIVLLAPLPVEPLSHDGAVGGLGAS